MWPLHVLQSPGDNWDDGSPGFLVERHVDILMSASSDKQVYRPVLRCHHGLGWRVLTVRQPGHYPWILSEKGLASSDCSSIWTLRLDHIRQSGTGQQLVA